MHIQHISIYDFARINNESSGEHSIYGMEFMHVLTMMVTVTEPALCSTMDFEKSCTGYS